MTILRTLVIALPLVAALGAAQADQYRFEMILFERPGGGGSETWPEAPEDLPETAGHTDLRSVAVGGRDLGREAAALDRQGMNVLAHIAWVQSPPPLASNSWYGLEAGRVSGLVRVRRGRFLHLDTDLVLHDAMNGQPYHVRHKRRMRSDELHYVDHPKVGVLVEATRIEPTAGVGADGEDAAAPGS